MTEERDFLSIPEHVPVKIAATMLKISEDRILQHIHNKRLRARKVDGRFQVYIPDIEAFKRNPPGRVRSQAPEWRKYDKRITLLCTTIHVRVLPGKTEPFKQYMQRLQKDQTHRFTGSMARYVLQGIGEAERVTILLFWKDNEKPSEEVQQQELQAFQDELGSLLDWPSAQIELAEGLLYT